MNRTPAHADINKTLSEEDALLVAVVPEAIWLWRHAPGVAADSAEADGGTYHKADHPIRSALHLVELNCDHATKSAARLPNLQRVWREKVAMRQEPIRVSRQAN